MVEHKESHQQLEKENRTTSKLQMMDNPDIEVDIFSDLVNFYRTYVKNNVDILRQKIAFSWDLIEQHSTALQSIHGLFLMLYGGSWLALATWMSFCVVYHEQDTASMLRTQGKVANMKTLWKTLNRLWLLTLVGFAVWTAPLLSKITVSFMLEKYVSGVIVNPVIMIRLQKLLPVIKMLGI